MPSPKTREGQSEASGKGGRVRKCPNLQVLNYLLVNQEMVSEDQVRISKTVAIGKKERPPKMEPS